MDKDIWKEALERLPWTIPQDRIRRLADELREACGHSQVVTCFLTMKETENWLSSYPESMKKAEEFANPERREKALARIPEKRQAYIHEIMRMTAGIPLGAPYWQAREATADLADWLAEKDLLRCELVFAPSHRFMEELYKGAFRTDLNDKIHVVSSQGDAWADHDGRVVALSEDWKRRDEGSAIPLKFDFREYMDYWKLESLPKDESVDILDLGFASDLGIIVPPAMDWREEIRNEADSPRP